MSSTKPQTIETRLAELEARLPNPAPGPRPPGVAVAFHDAALAVHDRTGSARLARRSTSRRRRPVPLRQSKIRPLKSIL